MSVSNHVTRSATVQFSEAPIRLFLSSTLPVEPFGMCLLQNMTLPSVAHTYGFSHRCLKSEHELRREG